MTNDRVPLRTSDIIEKMQILHAARIAEKLEHAYYIDPGMKLARKIFNKEQEKEES